VNTASRRATIPPRRHGTAPPRARQRRSKQLIDRLSLRALQFTLGGCSSRSPSSRYASQALPLALATAAILLSLPISALVRRHPLFALLRAAPPPHSYFQY